MNADNVALRVIGIDFNSAPPDVRAGFHLPSSRIAEVYGLRIIPESVMLLSTCNRTECYLMGSGTFEDAFGYLEEVFGRPVDRRYFYHYAGPEAWLHLLELAVGLKSMLIGETEILGQLQDAIQRSADCSAIAREHRQALGKVVAVARRIRHRTGIGGYSSSLYTLVLRELKKSLSRLDGLNVLILGNGVIARNLLRTFGNHGLAATVLVRNSGKKHAGPQPVTDGARIIFGYEHLPDLLREHPVIVTATAAPHYLLKAEHGELVEGKILIDLSFPRNIDPVLVGEGKCRLWDLQYFADLSAVNRLHKARAVTEARQQCLAALDRIIFKTGRKPGEQVEFRTDRMKESIGM